MLTVSCNFAIHFQGYLLDIEMAVHTSNSVKRNLFSCKVFFIHFLTQ